MERRQFVKASAAGAVILLAGKAVQASGPDNGPLRRMAKINSLVNEDNPTVLEKKHVPLVTVPKSVVKGKWFQVRVKVGFMIEHPSKPAHWIDRVELQVGGKKVAEIINVAGGITSPNACFNIRLDKPGDVKLEAVADCNIHGTWLSEPVYTRVT